MPAILVTGLKTSNCWSKPCAGGARLRAQDAQFPEPSGADRQPRAAIRSASSATWPSRESSARENEARRSELEHEIATAQARRAGAARGRGKSAADGRKRQGLRDFHGRYGQGRVVSWNPGAERLFGYAEPEIISGSIAMLFHPEDRAAGVPEREIATAAAKGRATDERWHQRKDGGRFFASGVVTPIFDEENKLRGFTKIARDITQNESKPKRPCARRPSA